jgi:hypothetical protein
MWYNNKSNGSTELTAHLKPGEPRNLGCGFKAANGEPNTGIPCQACLIQEDVTTIESIT